MSKLNYLKGYLKNIFNRRISKLALIDCCSNISDNARICRNVKLINSSVSDFTYIAPNTQVLNAKIGKYCSISYDVKIGLAKHSMNYISTSPIFTAKNNALRKQWVDKTLFNEFDDIIIGNDVWIGTNVIINSGIRIGNGSVIGAGTIITRDVPDYAIVVGVPGKVIKYRFTEEIRELLLKLNWWNLSEDFLRKNILLFQNEDLNIEDLKKLYESIHNNNML